MPTTTEIVTVPVTDKVVGWHIGCCECCPNLIEETHLFTGTRDSF